MSENGWLFPLVEALHLIAMAIFLGPILLGDLRVLGAIPSVPVGQMSKVAFVVVMLTGILLFTANASRYTRNPAFLWKMGLLAIAMAAHATVHARATRATAALSLTLWSLVILASRAVIDLDV